LQHPGHAHEPATDDGRRVFAYVIVRRAAARCTATGSARSGGRRGVQRSRDDGHAAVASRDQRGYASPADGATADVWPADVREWASGTQMRSAWRAGDRGGEALAMGLTMARFSSNQTLTIDGASCPYIAFIHRQRRPAAHLREPELLRHAAPGFPDREVPYGARHPLAGSTPARATSGSWRIPRRRPTRSGGRRTELSIAILSYRDEPATDARCGGAHPHGQRGGPSAATCETGS